MSEGYPDILNRLMKAFTLLPGIGPKSAERIVLQLLKESDQQVRELSKLLIESKEKVFFCDLCRNLTSEKLCSICKDPTRAQKILCIVESPKDVALVEKTGAFHGLYHVLFGTLSPIDGVGPQELRLDRLIKRIKTTGIEEVILATNPNAEGDTTALYMAESLKSTNVKVTRIARGVPIGSHLDYVDPATLEQAMIGRTVLS